VRYSEIEEGHPGSLHLAVIDKKQTILYNDSIARGAIHEFVDISSYGNSSFIAWKDGVDSKFAAIRLGK
jgi:hypothetical protein